MKCTFKNAQLNYQVRGNTGTPLLLLHGLLENSTMWKPLLKALPAERRLIVMDLPGHGLSECLGYVHSMTEMATAVKAVLEKEKIDQVQIIGHSMGAYVGLAFAKAYLNQISGLALLNSTPFADTRERAALRKRATEAAKRNYPALVSMSVANLFASQSHEEIPERIDQVKSQALKTPVQGYIAAQLGMMKREDLSAVWKEWPIEKCMILGREDNLINLEFHKKEFGSALPVIELNGGHMSLIENPDSAIQHLINFSK